MPSEHNLSTASDDSDNEYSTTARISEDEDYKIAKCSKVLKKVSVPAESQKKKRGRPKKNLSPAVTTNQLSNTAHTTDASLPGNGSTSSSGAVNVTAIATQPGNSSTPTSGVMNASSQSQLEKTLAGLTNELALIRSVVGDLKDAVNLALAKISQLEIDNVSLRGKLREKDKKIIDLEQALDDERQEAKKDTMIFSGPVVDSTSDTLQTLMVDNLKDKLKIAPEKASSIKFFKLGQAKNVVAAKIESDDLRSDLFKAAKTVKPNDFFISESLTSKRRTLLYQLRKLKKAKKIHSTFSFYGNIYYKQSDTGNRIRIKSLCEISTIVDAYNAEAAANTNDENLELIEYDC